MALIKSISGTRGTIGGRVGENLTAQDIVESTAAFAHWLLQAERNPVVVIGRDARTSGEMVATMVGSTLRLMGIKVLDLGLTTTPTLEVAVALENAGGGIMITASHNPREWNALKFLNHHGEFISEADGAKILQFIESKEVVYATIDNLGSYEKGVGYIRKHIELILALTLVQAELIRSRGYRVVVDCVNSTGAISIVPLLETLGCEVIVLNEEMHGRFAHNPEPLPENLTDLSKAVIFHKAHLGIAVDPDVDRLALVCEDGEMFGEEYTLVSVADYVLSQQPGPCVSNLSSTQALALVAKKQGQEYAASAVGEVHVVAKMKAIGAVIGGEGNGGIIYPRLHYGRDALVGIALFLSFLAEQNCSVSKLRHRYPNFTIVKDKVQLSPELAVDNILSSLQNQYRQYPQDNTDGLKIFVDEHWVHLRRSNTEPIIRIYAESASRQMAETLVRKIKSDIAEIVKEF